MLEETGRFSPDAYLRDNHPDVRVIDMRLPGSVQGCVDHERRIIWLDEGLSPVARRCTLAYELGELIQGPTPNDPCLAAARRRAAMEWSANMLIPLDRMLEAFTDLWRLHEIAERLDVDTATLRTRLRGLTDQEQDDLMLWTRGARELA